MRIKLILTAMAAMLLGTAVEPTRADITITVLQDGSNVVATGTGSVDLTGLTFGAVDSGSPATIPDIGLLVVGNSTSSQSIYTGATGPIFGPGGLTNATSSTGSNFGTNDSNGVVLLPTGYVSGTSLSGSATWDNKTFATLGLTPGTYQETWTGVTNEDTITVQIGPAATVAPEPSTAIVAVFGAVAFLAYGWSPTAGSSRGRPPPSQPSRTRDRTTRTKARSDSPAPRARRPLLAHRSQRRRYVPMWSRPTPCS